LKLKTQLDMTTALGIKLFSTGGVQEAQGPPNINLGPR